MVDTEPGPVPAFPGEHLPGPGKHDRPHRSSPHRPITAQKPTAGGGRHTHTHTLADKDDSGLEMI